MKKYGKTIVSIWIASVLLIGLPCLISAEELPYEEMEERVSELEEFLPEDNLLSDASACEVTFSDAGEHVIEEVFSISSEEAPEDAFSDSCDAQPAEEVQEPEQEPVTEWDEEEAVQESQSLPEYDVRNEMEMETAAQAQDPEQTETSEPAQPYIFSEREEAPDPVIELTFHPLEIKIKAPAYWPVNEITTVTLEIKNITNKPMQKLELILRSADPAYKITPYEKEAEARAALEGEGNKEKAERTFLIQELPSGESVKAELFLIASENTTVTERGMEAEYVCSFEADSVRYFRTDKWKIELEAVPADAYMEELPATREIPDQESEMTELADQACVEPEIPDQESEMTELADQAYVQPETSQEEDLVIFQADGSLAGEEEYSDWEYDDDWTTYYYDGGYGDGAAQINTATPHIIVESYSHKKTIYTSDAFPIEISFLNTSQKLGMESIMIQVETSDSLSLANGTNTFFLNELAPGGTATQRVHLLASSQCKETPQKLTLTIKFEYVDQNERKEGSSTETINLPIAQKERLELKDPSYDDMEAGKEGLISISYVNKGYAALNNMEASLQLEDADTVQEVIYIGNVDSGKNGTIDFLVTPYLDGDYTGTVTLTYEDLSQEEKAVTKTLTVYNEKDEAVFSQDFIHASEIDEAKLSEAIDAGAVRYDFKDYKGETLEKGGASGESTKTEIKEKAEKLNPKKKKSLSERIKDKKEISEKKDKNRQREKTKQKSKNRNESR